MSTHRLPGAVNQATERSFVFSKKNAEADEIDRVCWSVPFRFAFCLLFLFLLLSDVVIFSPLSIIPFVGDAISNGISFVAFHAAQWTGVHAFHLSGIAMEAHPTDSRDTALNWITLGLILCASVFGALVWRVLDRRRPHYQTAAAWLRFLLRMLLVFLMLRYGSGKVFPLQMSRPSLAVLNEPLGQSSPMTLLWTMIGLQPLYQILCGAFEMLAGVLLFFRRTALLGALLNAFIMSNVLLFNLFFDVPVKLGAGLILLTTIAVIAPDLGSLYEYFWLHRMTAPTGLWVPPLERREFRIGTRVIEVGFVLLAIYNLVPGAYTMAKQESQNVRHPGALTGEWHVDSDVLRLDGHNVDTPVLTAEGSPLTALYLEPDGRVMARSSDGRLWRAGIQVDPQKRTLSLYSGWFEGTRFQGSYLFAQPDPNHLVLKPFGDGAGMLGTLTLSRVPLPDHYPLLDRGFHWINEWALER